MKKTKQQNACVPHGIIKVLLIMKITIVLLLISLVQVSANGLAQSISLKLNNAELKKALFTIERKSNCRFLYNDDAVSSVNTKVNINVENAPVTDVLNKIFTGTGLTYKLLDNHLIVLSAKENPIQDIRVKGRVTDVTGAAVSGATVRVKGTNVAVSADDNGNFSIPVPENGALVISSVGYNEIEVAVNGRTEINVKLTVSTQVLDQVVVVGYGTQRKIDVTGSVAQIKGDEIAKQGVTNPVSGLQGKVAGVQIINTGQPGSAPSIMIRGVGTYTSQTAPLYVVDGVWLDDISFLNPSDIASMSILKDASSEAIYGVRGANGVVLITTKNGSVKGKTIVNYNGSVGWGVATNIPQMATGNQYAIMFNELARINGASTFLDSSQFGTGTEWFNQELRNAVFTNHQISVNGGSEKSTYNLSLGYLNQQGVLKTNDYGRYTLNFRNDINITKNIKTGYNIIGTYSKSFDPPGSIWRDLYTAPNILPVRFSNGKYGDPGYYGLGQVVVNPQVAMDYNNATTQIYHVNANAYLDIKFLRHFTLHSSVGGIYDENDHQSFTPVYSATSTQNSAISTLSKSQASIKNWLIENTLTYNNSFGDNRITAMIGQSAYRFYNNTLTATANNGSLSSNPATWYLNLGLTPFATESPTLEQESSYFGRVTYAYKDRYTLTGTLRSDADSRFTANYGRANQPSIGAAWIISNEDFMKNQHIFDVLKLRGSWGRVGNANIPNGNAYIATQAVNTTGSVVYNPVTNTIISGAASVTTALPPALKWEIGGGTDIGLEAGFLKNRLNIEAGYYTNKTDNFIFPVLFPSSNGYTNVSLPENVGVAQNKGFEFAINWKQTVNRDFSYGLSFNGAFNQNKFVTNSIGGSQQLYDGGNGSTGGQLATLTTEGMPIGQYYGYKVIGIFQTATDVQNYKDANGNMYQPNAIPGDFMYASTTGVGPISGNDRVVLGNPNPKFIYGFNTNFSYKRFDLSVDFNGVVGVDLYNANKGLRYGNENFTENFWQNRWHGAGTSNTYPSVNLGGGMNYYINSWYVENGSYLRIRNIQLGYSFDNGFIGKSRTIQGLRIFVNAQNPVIFTKYTGFSPEVGGAVGSIGIDNNVYPLSAVYTFGVNLTF
jgi:TonB-linked SusC/RagA family outer membrane protein